ncbi:radical SAM protein [Ruminiclostridium cellulolyticum]|uniref:Radical SAM domain protein n=1 Tax=Ruminiclostridium cellulolyticum (strain ATCC 35319 / DSM 5812 / JCM 6584 / H10) TaxID=394503 RepID=B8I963_RUMCH|nr:radical SAM protein [Ruminiclostridium cellulolyticum]ACL75323.1 Radical SAM domain protein [Ruminiclostridium cellulolyticum H10]
MFIDDVIAKIWEPSYIEYKRIYDKAMNTDTDKLFHTLAGQKMSTIYYPNGLTMSVLATSGCPHRFREDRISGCSMCNYQSYFFNTYASMAALKKKDINLYAKAVRLSFENARGVMSKPNLFELISASDTLSREELPPQAFEELFGKNDLFSKKPFKYIMETRAPSVTSESMEMLKKYLGNKSRVLLELGIESSDEWIRNHWINKDITNKDIITAVELIHQAGFKFSINILFGIPMLTEQQSIEIFKKSVEWADELGADEILCFPLSRKEGTLQGFLYKELRDSQRLIDAGLVNGEHTGLPWLFSALEAVHQVAVERPSVIKKLNFAQQSSAQSPVENTSAYNSSIDCYCSRNNIDVLEQFGRDKNIAKLEEALENLQNDPCYKDYVNLIKKQKNAGNISDTITILGEEIAKKLWPESCEEKLYGLKKELTLYGTKE